VHPSAPPRSRDKARSHTDSSPLRESRREAARGGVALKWTKLAIRLRLWLLLGDGRPRRDSVGYRKLSGFGGYMALPWSLPHGDGSAGAGEGRERCEDRILEFDITGDSVG